MSTQANPDSPAQPDRRALLRTAAAAVGAVGAATALGRPASAAVVDPGHTVHLLGTPVRVYDSRLPSSLGSSGTGPIATGHTRSISLQFSNGVPSHLLDLGSAGAMVNVTVVNTVGSGFLVVSSPRNLIPSTSNINWTSSNQVIANMAVTALDEGSLQVAVGGGGSTDVVIDVMAILSGLAVAPQ